MKILKLKIMIGVVLSCVFSQLMSSPTTVVKFGPSSDYVTSSQVFNRKDGNNNIPFALDVPMSPLTGYLAPAEYSGTFYGGYEKRLDGVLSDTLQTDGHGVHNNQVSGNDSLRLRTHPYNVQGLLKVSMLIVFQKDDFLELDAEDVVSFDENSAFKYWVNGDSWGSSVDAALVIREGENFYRSELFVPVDQHAMSDPILISELDWYEYDPFSGIDIVGAGTLATPSFNDITVAGMYMSGTVMNGRALIQLVGLEIEGNVGPAVEDPPPPAPERFFLTEERLTTMEILINQEDPVALYFQSRLNEYLTTMPYFRSQFAAAYALGYILLDDEDYLDRSKELISTYFADPTVGWVNYQNRNSFRTGGRWPFLVYNWLRPHFTTQESQEIEDFMVLWANYWLDYTKHTQNYDGLLISDSDDITSLVENLTIMGYVLSDSATYSTLGETLLTVADEMLELFVVNYYMHDIGAGGYWMEGSDYSPHTQEHWIRTFIMNKEMRNIEYPSDYANQTALALIHQTLAGETGVFQYGSVEHGTDYRSLSDDYRPEFVAHLLAVVEDPEDRRMLYNWYERMAEEGPYSGYASRSGLYELLFLNPGGDSLFDYENLDPFHFAPGIGLVSLRTDWSEEATNLYMMNRRVRVHHEKRDALNFEVAYKGGWVTKGVTGYSGFGSYIVNSLLVENAEKGWSSPTGRSLGNPFYRSIYNDELIGFISAEAKDVYNMSGYYETTYAHSVARQLMMVKPNLIIVHDHVETYPDEIRDLRQYKPELGLNSGDSYIRTVAQLQHVQAEPELLDADSQTYRIFSGGESELIWQMAWPKNAVIDVIDQKDFFAGASAHSIPQNQKKWHFHTEYQNPQVVTDFVSFLLFDEAPLVDPLAGSDPIVFFGPSTDYVTADSNLQVTNGYAPFSLSSPISPSNMASPSGFSSTFYGGVEVRMNDEIELSWLNIRRVTDDVNNDHIRVSTRWGTQELSTVFMWKSDQFLGDYSNSAVAFDDQTVLRFLMSSNHASQVAMVIEDNNQLYHSELISLSPNNSARSGLIVIQDLEWYSYDPASEIRIDHQNPGTPVSPALDSVTAMGMYGYGSAGNAVSIYLNEFHVIQLPEPEPDPEFEPMPWELLSEENGGIIQGHVFAAVVEGGESNYLILFNRDVTNPQNSFVELALPDWFTPDYIYCLGWESDLYLEVGTWYDQGTTMITVEPFTQQDTGETRLFVNEAMVATGVF